MGFWIAAYMYCLLLSDSVKALRCPWGICLPTPLSFHVILAVGRDKLWNRKQPSGHMRRFSADDSISYVHLLFVWNVCIHCSYVLFIIFNVPQLLPSLTLRGSIISERHTVCICWCTAILYVKATLQWEWITGCSENNRTVLKLNTVSVCLKWLKITSLVKTRSGMKRDFITLDWYIKKKEKFHTIIVGIFLLSGLSWIYWYVNDSKKPSSSLTYSPILVFWSILNSLSLNVWTPGLYIVYRTKTS